VQNGVRGETRGVDVFGGVVWTGAYDGGEVSEGWKDSEANMPTGVRSWGHDVPFGRRWGVNRPKERGETCEVSMEEGENGRGC